MTGVKDELSEGRVFLGACVGKECFKGALMALTGTAALGMGLTPRPG